MEVRRKSESRRNSVLYLLFGSCLGCILIFGYGLMNVHDQSPHSKRKPSTFFGVEPAKDVRNTVRADSFDFGLMDILHDIHTGEKLSVNQNSGAFDTQECTMQQCFDFQRCRGLFKLFVYPEDKFLSPIYKNLLAALRASGYATENPEEACVFVLGLDTLDRDRLSDQYITNIDERIHLDPLVQKYWNNGRNHIIFNLYSGTFPDYFEDDIGFDIGYAILAKASMSTRKFRKGFDVSLPLFHNTLPVRGEDAGRLARSTRYPELARSYLVSFKGKRYLYGIGSNSRNSLYHIHNGKDIIILTTCRHGKQSKELRDERCDRDDSLYDRYDYQTLLDNTTFCLVPRGRRLGSFRFLESLQAGCVPVILSNDWELPFTEVIDWNKAAVMADERLLTQIPSLLRSIHFDRILIYRQQTQLLWRQYFSSIERIVVTTLEIVRNRLATVRRAKDYWNKWPAMAMSQLTHIELDNFHRGFIHNVHKPRLYTKQNLTILVNVTSKQNLMGRFVRLLKVINRIGFVDKVIVFSPWKATTLSTLNSWTWLRTPFRVEDAQLNFSQLQQAFRKQVSTEGVLLVQDDCSFTWEDFEYGFHVWKSFPSRIVGYRAASHYWDEPSESWKYSDKLTNEYSLVFMKEAFFHVQYYGLLWHYKEKVVPNLPDICLDILLNFLAARITRVPPARLTRKMSDEDSITSDMDRYWITVRQRSDCINELVQLFGYMPLLRSSVVYNPVLYKDNVSSYRKKYRQLENSLKTAP
ncbi:exostosin-1-like [Paramacrobiotus metropolitanus]|uniref:exostosin-1-like n=1 Tax=Paramacrobiotus metropolitanus TaxID=2943436 RepID=UPI002445840F|nr:exostosin-1-like [Paramacrobiotus metropolitanus]